MTDNQQPQRNPWDPPEEARAAHQPEAPAPENSFDSTNPSMASANNDSANGAGASSPYGSAQTDASEGAYGSTPTYGASNSDGSVNSHGSSGAAHQAPSFEAPSYGSASSAAQAPAYGSANSTDPYSSSYGSSSYNSSPFGASSASSASGPAAGAFGSTTAGAATTGAQGAPIPAGEPAPGTDLGNDIGKSLSWAFTAFGRNLAPLLVPTIVWAVLTVFASIPFMVGYIRAIVNFENNGFLGTGNFIAMIVGMFLLIVCCLLWASGPIKVAGMIARGEKPSIGHGFVGGRALITAIVVAIIIVIGYILLVLPGVILTVLLIFAPYAASTDKLGVGAALKASVDVVKSKLGFAIITYIVITLIGMVAGATLIGMLVAIPIYALYFTASYMRGSGRIPAEAK